MAVRRGPYKLTNKAADAHQPVPAPRYITTTCVCVARAHTPQDSMYRPQTRDPVDSPY